MCPTCLRGAYDGRRLVTSVGGVVTGRGADMIVLDDPQQIP